MLARTDVNEAGWRRYLFEPCPYVHRTLQGADQEARRVSRFRESDVAIVGLVHTISTAVTVEDSRTVTPVELMQLLVKETAESNTPIHPAVARSIIRKIFDGANINFRHDGR